MSLTDTMLGQSAAYRCYTLARAISNNDRKLFDRAAVAIGMTPERADKVWVCDVAQDIREKLEVAV